MKSRMSWSAAQCAQLPRSLPFQAQINIHSWESLLHRSGRTSSIKIEWKKTISFFSFVSHCYSYPSVSIYGLYTHLSCISIINSYISITSISLSIHSSIFVYLFYAFLSINLYPLYIYLCILLCTMYPYPAI